MALRNIATLPVPTGGPVSPLPLFCQHPYYQGSRYTWHLCSGLLTRSPTSNMRVYTQQELCTIAESETE